MHACNLFPFKLIDGENPRWKGQAHIALDYFPPNVDKVNFYAIHGTDTELKSERVYKSYKSVPGEFPDFHRLEHFANNAIDLPNILSAFNARSDQSAIWGAALKDDNVKSKS